MSFARPSMDKTLHGRKTSKLFRKPYLPEQRGISNDACPSSIRSNMVQKECPFVLLSIEKQKTVKIFFRTGNRKTCNKHKLDSELLWSRFKMAFRGRFQKKTLETLKEHGFYFFHLPLFLYIMSRFCRPSSNGRSAKSIAILIRPISRGGFLMRQHSGVIQIFSTVFFGLLCLFGQYQTSSALEKPTNVLFVNESGSHRLQGHFDFSSRNVIHYNRFSLDITKKKPYRDGHGRLISIPNTRAFEGAYEVTYHFWHPRNERHLLDAIVVKTYDRKGRLLKHGAFDRGVFVVLLTHDLFHDRRIQFIDIGKFIKGDPSLYVKVRVQNSQKIALVPFTTFLTDFTRRINTVPVASWAVR